MHVGWCLTSADSAVHQPEMKATDPDDLNGRLLTERTEFLFSCWNRELGALWEWRETPGANLR